MIMDWLRDTVNKVGKYQGWCSEHDYARDRIDLWVTAQVAQFLLDYRNIRRKLVIRSTSERAGLVTVPPSSLGSWDAVDPTDLELSSKLQIKNMIEEKFVVPFKKEGKLSSSSLLLYGPPGTSKTSLMKALANRLDWEFAQITPADFLSAGEEQVEARATLLFEILKRAKHLVVLFDEVDEFLFDRDLKDRPGGIFRFMTTSMLPKLQSLKSQRNLIFGIATNYKERLDKAITRLGRVDYAWPVFPPDFESRIALIKKFDSGIDEKKARALAADTPLFSYLELERVVLDKSGIKDPWKIVTHPTASLKAYANRPEAEDEFKELLRTQITEPIVEMASKGTKKQLKDQLRAIVVKVQDPEEHSTPRFNNDTVGKIQALIKQLG
jgi:SpoVK/Ycf46/Vps4 family AAA+-type ATPase